MRGPKRRAAAAGLLATAAIAAACGSGEGAELGGGDRRATPAEVRGRPDIVVVTTDDQPITQTARGLPRLSRRIAERGVTFTESVVTTPLCCPSRASFITGQYAHNHGILQNSPGYPLLRAPESVLPAWLRAGGYRTALVGKYLNGYGEESGDNGAAEPAPGWDDWRVMLRGYAYRGFRLGIDGRVVDHPAGAYLTDELTNHAVEVISDHAERRERRPLFLWLNYWAPHLELSRTSGGACRGSAIPADRDLALARRARLPRSPARVEADVSDKPPFVSDRRPVRAAIRRRLRREFGCQLASLRAVDRGIARVREALAGAGRLANAVLVFTSDNGFLHGEHRIKSGKGVAYEESIRVPLMIEGSRRALGAKPSRRVDELVANIDLAPTILDLAGADPCLRDRGCRELDGRSLLPLLRGERSRWPRRRELVIESADGKPCAYTGLRTRRALYVEYEEGPGECRGGARELYDLERDPFQLANLAGLRAREQALGRWSRRLDRRRDCAGIDCRQGE